jgi:CHAT domain-containing protein
MFYRISLIFFVFLFFYSCRTNVTNDLQENSVIDTASLYKYFTNKQTDSAMFLADDILDNLKKQGNPNNFIKFCQTFIDSLKKNGGSWKSQQKYYAQIFKFDNSKNLDSNSYKSLVNAYFKWGLLSFRNESRIDDSLIICFEKSIGLSKKKLAKPYEYESYAFFVLGIEYNKIGDLKKSLNYHQLEANLINKTNGDWVASNTINQSIVLKEMGYFDTAQRLINTALEYPKIANFKRADLLTILSEIQTQKNEYKDAGLSIANAVKMLDTLSKVTAEIEEKKAQALKQKGILQRLNNENTASVQTLEQAILHYKATGNSNGRYIAKIYIELGKSYDATAQYDSALKYYQIALQKVIKVDSESYFSMPIKEQLYAENTIIEALDAKAITLEKMFALNHQQKYVETAVQCYDIISTVEKQLLQNFSYDESRLIMLRENRTRSERAINTCYKLFTITGNNYWSQQGFQFAENSKAFVLLESIKRNIQSNSALQNDSLYEKVQSLQTRVAYTDRKLFENSNVKSDSIYRVLLREKSKLNEQFLLANNELKLSPSSYKALANKIDTANIIDKATDLLDNKTAVVEFFTGDSSNYIFMFSKKDGMLFLKAQPSFLPNLKSYVDFFSDKNKINNSPSAYQHAAYNFYNEIGLAKNIPSNISSLIIITDGTVNNVPFEALVTAIGKDVSPKSFSYLLFTKQISYGYSIATLAAQTNNTSTSAKTITCYAPVFSNNECGKQPLLYSIGELDAIKNSFTDGNYFLKNTATLAQFKNTVEDAGIVHIATHANADTSVGMQSSINFFDSALYLNEVYNLHLKANLVVLSACETNIGIINKSEGAMSLARGFYYAGARNVETSLWNVNDKSTATLFSHFYNGIKDNNYIAALRNAKLQYLQNASAASSSPYYWAGFIHIGYNKPHSYPIIFISLILLSNLLIIFLLLRKIICAKY